MDAIRKRLEQELRSATARLRQIKSILQSKPKRPAKRSPTRRARDRREQLHWHLCLLRVIQSHLFRPEIVGFADQL